VNRTNAVPGEGSGSSGVMFIGEAPGRSEDEMGRPFVGRAGQLLTELIGEAGLRREDVYITNVVKCRPPGNRDPLEDEIRACLPYLRRQIVEVTIYMTYHPAAALYNPGLLERLREDFRRIPSLLRSGGKGATLDDFL